MRFTEISESSPEDRFKKYIRPVTKTTPKIERTTNPSGRTTDHVEWLVTSDTGEKRRFTSKKEAQEYYDLCTKQSVAEGSLNELSSGLLQRAAQLAKNKRNQAMDPELHNALGGGYMNPLATHYDNVSQKINNRAAQVGKKETIQKIASKIASPAVMRKMGMSDMEEGVAEGPQDDPEDYRAHLLKTLPRMMNFLSKNVKGWKPTEEQYLAAIETGYQVMKHTGDVQQAGKAMSDELNTLHRMSQSKSGMMEGSEIKIPTEDGITMQDIRLMAGDGPLTKKTILQAIAVIRKQRRPQGVAEGEYDSRKPFGVRYKVFAGREGRMTTKEYWTSSEEKLQRAVDKIQALNNFYEIDGYSYPKEQQGVAEAFPNPGSGSTGSSKEDKRIAAALQKKHIPTTPNDKKEKGVAEEWSKKYKNSINCSHPKGFSQKAHCAGKKKHNESIEMEMTCEDCGMCKTHGDHENLDEACWKGYHKEGNKKMFGKTYPNCVKNEGEESTDQVLENLHKWFKEKWVRFGPDGKIRGDCARGSESEGKPKCLPQSKAHSLGKKGRASAASRKRREDPNANRSGKAINVSTKGKGK